MNLKSTNHDQFLTDFNLTKYQDHLLFAPVGGSSEIGMNLNLYYYKGKWLIVDMGAGFADEHYPGIDLLIPNIDFLTKYKDDILGLVITHAHEDHIGGVEHLWREITCPIYTTPFTASFLRAKLVETDFYNDIQINEVACDSSLELAPFKLNFVSLTHSAPEMQAIFIETDLGTVMHTGDWKFDHNPLIGKANDEELLSSYGDKGVLAMVTDSTNIFNEEFSGSEGDLRESLIEIIGKCKNKVIVTTFASNLARIETLAVAAKQNNRKIFVAGKSLRRIIETAKQTGYLEGLDFHSDAEISKYPSEEILIVCTGCQGEPLAAMTKIAYHNHPTISLQKDDTVIFSSKIIPGNEKKIFRLFNALIASEIEVLTERDHFVHVSGHPGRKELRKMYGLIRPQIAIPVHGEPLHIYEHAKLTESLGIKQTIKVEDGAVINLAPGNAEVISKISMKCYVVDGNYLVPSDSRIMKDRRRMRDNGIILVSLFMTRGNVLKTEPLIIAPGLLDSQKDKALINKIRSILMKNLESNYKYFSNRSSDDKIIEITRSTIKKFIKSDLGKDPSIEVSIARV